MAKKKPTYCKECSRGEGEHYDHCSKQHPPITDSMVKDAVDHPAHYGGKDNPYETIKVIEAWGLGFNLGNAVKYISRAGLKDEAKHLEDLRKARWYLDRAIMNMEGGTK